MKINLSGQSIAGVSTAVLTTALVSYAPSASAMILRGTSSDWSNPEGGYDVTYYDADSDPDGFSQIRWGDPAESYNPELEQSGLGFKGVGQTIFNFNETFQLGTLKHYNETIYGGGAASSVDLEIHLDFGALFGMTNFTFNLGIDETPNVAGTCAYTGDTICPDKIYWNDEYASESFDVDGTQYTLQLDGFRETANGPMLDHFISEENGTSQAHLFGRIVEMPTQAVPEPVSIMGSAVAIGLGSMFRKKRNDKKSAK